MTNLCDYYRGLTMEVADLMADGFKLPPNILVGNPLGIMVNPNFAWRGQIGRDEEGRCIFLHGGYGLRAGAILFMAHEWYKPALSVRDLLSPWTAADKLWGNDMVDYVARVLAVNPDEPFDLHAHAHDGMRAVVGYLCGQSWKGLVVREYYTPSFYREAVAASHLL